MGRLESEQMRNGQRSRLYLVKWEKLCLLDSINEQFFICSH